MVSTPSPESLRWLPATTFQRLLAAVAFGGGLVGFSALVVTGHSLRYCVIGVLLTGVLFFLFLALFARRSIRRITANAPVLAAALPAANRSDNRSFLVEQAIRILIIIVALTLLLGNPALPGIALGGGLSLLLTARLIGRWQEEHHESLVVARRPRNPLLPERPTYYRISERAV
jgi:hypothetical protein